MAKEIAIPQPYQERIVINTGSKTNCSLWAVKMAAKAGMELGTFRMRVFPSPNDLQHALNSYRNTDGYTLTDSTQLQEDAQQIDVNVGTVPAPQIDPESGELILQNLNDNEVNVLKDWARQLD